MKRAFITGITGQDGSYLADLLLSKEYEVFGLVRRTSQASLGNISHLLTEGNLHLIQGDVTDISSIIRGLSEAKPHEIYNLAAQSHVRVSFDEPLHTLRVTGEGALNVFEAMRQVAPHARVYQASSSEQFGSSLGTLYSVPVNSDDSKAGNASYFQDEGTSFHPRSPYGCAKVFAHASAVLYREAYGLHISCGILFNHESERRGDTFVSRKITKYIGELRSQLRRRLQDAYHNATREELVSVLKSYKNYFGDVVAGFPKLKLGNLQAFRDWGHASDYVKGMWLMLQQDKPDDYVLATGQTYTVEDFVIKAFKMIGITNPYDFIETDVSLYRPAEFNYLHGNSTKARAKLGWRPEISFDQLVRKMVQYDCGER